MTAHWAMTYLGRPWVEKTYTCGHFFVDVMRERFGIEVAVIDHAAHSMLSCVRAFRRGHPELQNWVEVEAPEEGDAVEMSHAHDPHHIGVWVAADGGGVLHNVRGAGVVFSSRSALRLGGWNIVSIQRHRSRL